MALSKVDSIELAKYILNSLGAMPHLKLQKLLYFIQAWHLAIFEQHVFDDEFEAWMHGPVTRKVWNNFKDKSILYDNIELPANELIKAQKKITSILSKDQMELIQDVLNEYGNKTAYYLECLTHEDMPWLSITQRSEYEFGQNETIPKDLIKFSYQSKLNSKNE